MPLDPLPKGTRSVPPTRPPVSLGYFGRSLTVLIDLGREDECEAFSKAFRDLGWSVVRARDKVIDWLSKEFADLVITDNSGVVGLVDLARTGAKPYIAAVVADEFGIRYAYHLGADVAIPRPIDTSDPIGLESI